MLLFCDEHEVHGQQLAAIIAQMTWVHVGRNDVIITSSCFSGSKMEHASRTSVADIEATGDKPDDSTFSFILRLSQLGISLIDRTVCDVM